MMSLNRNLPMVKPVGRRAQEAQWLTGRLVPLTVLLSEPCPITGLWPDRTSAATGTFAPFSKQQQGQGAAGAGGRGFGVEDKGPHKALHALSF